jgi:hypothetical protein
LISPDKIFHLVAFGVLAMTFWCGGWISSKVVVVTILGFWCVIDEITQAMLPLNRPFSYADLLASFLGVLAAASWFGAISTEATSDLKTSIETMLSKSSNWLLLGSIAIFGSIGLGILLWFILWQLFKSSMAPAAMTSALLVTAGVLVLVVVKKIQIEIHEIVAKLLPKLLALGVCSVVFGFFCRETELGPWTVGLAFFTITSSRAWYATCTENSVKKAM